MNSFGKGASKGLLGSIRRPITLFPYVGNMAVCLYHDMNLPALVIDSPSPLEAVDRCSTLLNHCSQPPTPLYSLIMASNQAKDIHL